MALFRSNVRSGSCITLLIQGLALRSSGFDQVSIDTLNRRLWIVTIFVLVMFSVLVLRLWYLQALNGKRYRTQSENNRIHLQEIPPFRGLILDRNGEPLVDNVPSYNLYVTPDEIQDKEQLLKNLKILLGLNPDEVRSQIAKDSKNQPFQPVLIKKNLSRDELAIIETYQYNLPGVRPEVRYQRSYLYGNFATHIIGYLGEISEKELAGDQYPDSLSGDYIGKSGVERRWQKVLNGVRGGKQVEVDATGRKLQELSKIPPVSGENITLTIDRKLQAAAENMLRDKTGTIVAMDPNNGEILAMASSPSFDPNAFIAGIDKTEWKTLMSGKNSPLQNKALSGQYPPGSIFKMVMALAGLEEGAVTPDETVSCTGVYAFGNRAFHCWQKKGHGTVDLHKALRESCDVYFYKLGNKLGIEKIAYYAKMCGLGKSTGIELDSEKDGLIPNNAWKKKRFGVPWQPGETISTSIGQSFVLVTPIQVASLISTIFNGGKVYQPKIVRESGSEKDKGFQPSPTLLRTLNVKKQNLELVKSGLIAVVNEPHGTGSSARLREVTVAGKTGTAQVVTLERQKALKSSGADSDEYKDHAWFAGIAPAENPKIAIAVLIEHGSHGGSTAAPLARDLIKEYLGIGQLQPVASSIEQKETESD
jgi:penicillin-binding protein 2